MKTAYRVLMGLCAMLAASGPVSAALITLAGGNFDVEYEQTQVSLALFGTPSIAGGNILFSANNFLAQSANGQGASSTAGSITLYLVPHQNVQVSGLSLFAFGDYRLQGAGSHVQVSGSLAADDDASSDPLRAASRSLNITSPAAQNGQITSPLNNQNVNWQAYAGLNANSNLWLLTAPRVAVTISSMLTAFTDSGSPDPNFAFIQEKLFVQQPAVSITVSSDPMVVPIPPALLLLLGGGSLLGVVGVRRSGRLSKGIRMHGKLDHLLKLILAAVLCGGWIPHAGATMVTVTGSLFDVHYDDVQLNPSSGQFSLFGAPTISGSNIIFRPNNLFAQSNSNGLVGVPATFNLTIVPRTGMQLQVSALSLTELGDFSLTGDGSYVNIGGQLIAYDPANFFSYTTSNLAMVSPGNTANTVSALPNVQNVNWVAQAAINSSANPSPFANPVGVNVVLENQLQAYAPTSNPNSFAFIQKKVAGDTVTLTVVSQVPIPAAGLLFASGFLGLMGMARRRGRPDSKVIA